VVEERKKKIEDSTRGKRIQKKGKACPGKEGKHSFRKRGGLLLNGGGSQRERGRTSKRRSTITGEKALPDQDIQRGAEKDGQRDIRNNKHEIWGEKIRLRGKSRKSEI